MSIQPEQTIQPDGLYLYWLGPVESEAVQYPHHGSVVERRLAQWELCLVATPGYLAPHGVQKAAVKLDRLNVLYLHDVSHGAGTGGPTAGSMNTQPVHRTRR